MKVYVLMLRKNPIGVFKSEGSAMKVLEKLILSERKEAGIYERELEE